MTSNGFWWPCPPCPPCPPLRRSSPERPAWGTGQKANEDKQNKMKGPWRRLTQREEAEEPKREDSAIDSTNVPSGKNNRTRCENVKDGQIVWLPKMDQIKSNSLILKHEKHEATYNHPALVVRVGKDIAEIRPITSLNGQSLREKYGNNEMQHDVHVFIQDSRNNCGRFDNPNGSPSLNIAGGLDLVSPSYVRAEKCCWIERDQLWKYSDVPMYLDEDSIKRVQLKLCDRIYEAETDAHREARKKARADFELKNFLDRTPQVKPRRGLGPSSAILRQWNSAPAVLESTKSTKEKEAAEKPGGELEETKMDKAVEAPTETEGSSDPPAAEEAAEPTDTEEGNPLTLKIDGTTTTDTEENPDQTSPQHLDPGASNHPRVNRLRRVKSLNPTEFLMSTLCFSDRHASI